MICASDHVLVASGPATRKELPHRRRDCLFGSASREGLSELGVECLDYILLTHIHIDHAGGIGHLVKSFPEAKTLAPERGHKHLVNPSRLWEGSLKTLGDMVLAFGKMLPPPENALFSGPEYPERPRVLDTPGHAPHHQSFIYTLPEGNILFAGEAAGVVLNMEMLPRWIGGFGGTDMSMPDIPVPSVPDVAYMYPATPPVVNPDIARKSLWSLIAARRAVSSATVTTDIRSIRQC